MSSSKARDDIDAEHTIDTTHAQHAKSTGNPVERTFPRARIIARMLSIAALAAFVIGGASELWSQSAGAGSSPFGALRFLANPLVTNTSVAPPSAHAAVTIDYWPLAFVFLLSTFIGIGVIARVSRLLHTPLMSLTNAISAIAVVGSILVTGEDHPPGIRILGAIALFASMTNIVSGFLITDRMLKMFKQAPKPGAKPAANGATPAGAR